MKQKIKRIGLFVILPLLLTTLALLYVGEVSVSPDGLSAQFTPSTPFEDLVLVRVDLLAEG